MRALTDAAVKNSDHKIKIKTETLAEIFKKNSDENHVTVIFMIHMILTDSLDKIKADQKIVFSLKNMIIAEKIICVLNVII
jgi:hypothetical protein